MRVTRIVLILLVTVCFSFTTISHAKIKNIIFDFGGVLIEIEHAKTRLAFEKLGANDFFTRFYSQNVQCAKTQAFEEGKLSPNEFRSHAKCVLGIQGATDAEFDTAWNALIVGYRSEKFELVKELKSLGYKVYLMSNTNQIHFDYFSSLYEIQTGLPFSQLTELFHGAYFLHEFGIKKPSPESYQMILSLNHLIAHETLYVDDTLAYVQAAERVGMPALYITPSQTIFSIPEVIQKLDSNTSHSQSQG